MELNYTHARELLKCAALLCEAQPETQVNLRRAVSTAYYALFHFLIEETCGHWERTEQRSRLARMFEHRTMLNTSDRIRQKHARAPSGSVEARLYFIANSFCELQFKRNMADYDLSKELAHDDVAVLINDAEAAIETWSLIHNEQIAQDYLYSLLFKDR